jgi:hypothetical protein
MLTPKGEGISLTAGRKGVTQNEAKDLPGKKGGRQGK